MRWIGFGALLLSACSLAACGGSTTIGNVDTGGSGGTAGSGGSAGTVGGCNCATGYHCQIVSGSYTCVPDPGTGGSGGTAGAAGAGGSGGTTATECSADLKAGATLGGAQVGFGSSSPSGNAKVAQVAADSLELTSSSTSLKFNWVGPALTGHFSQGEPVEIGRQDGWDYVAGLSSVAAARRDYGFVAPPEIPPIPMLAGPHLAYGTECTFKEAQGGCGQAPGTVKLLTVDATTGAGIVSAGQRETVKIIDWQIHNDSSTQYPGYGSSSCVAEAGFASVIAALGPSPVNGGP
jgi:hypothetical protein